MKAKATATARCMGERSAAPPPGKQSISLEDYQGQLHVLQVVLVQLQRHFIGCDDEILVLVEGRDAAGKDGSIKRTVEYLSPRETRVVALGKRSDREVSGWHFQRYVAQLPVAEEFVLFNRSWYNRAGVEHVMGFCSKQEHEVFMHAAPKFEEMLVNSGIKLFKYYPDIVRTNNKRLARLNLIRDILSRLHYAGKKNKLVQPDCTQSQRLAR